MDILSNFNCFNFPEIIIFSLEFSIIVLISLLKVTIRVEVETMSKPKPGTIVIGKYQFSIKIYFTPA